VNFVGFALIAAGAFVVSFNCPASELLRQVRVNGVELHYLEQGRGVPVVFVHGGLVDYRRWADQIEPFARHYRVISYSRRYNFPNQNSPLDPAYSPVVDADDLAALIKKLQLGRVHVIGESYGPYAALFLAAHHPETVRRLVLSEAPMLRWLNTTPEGEAMFADFQERLWQPFGRAFNSGNPAEAMKLIVRFFFDGAAVDSIPADVQSQLKANLREWEALGASRDAFPTLGREEVAGIRAPTLLMGGEQTLPLHRLLDAQYAAVLPNNRRLIIPKATHEMWDEQPVACREAALTFLDQWK